MSVNVAALAFGLWSLFLLVALAALTVLGYRRRTRLYPDEHLLKYERCSTGNSEDKASTATFWTLQQYDEISGKPWYALLEYDSAGVFRGWTGYRPELEALARILNITPHELPPTTAQEFFIRTNISALRPIVRKP